MGSARWSPARFECWGASQTERWSRACRSGRPTASISGSSRDGKLKTVPASGGPPRTLCEEIGLGAGGTWNRAGDIVFAEEQGTLARVPAAGGPCTPLTKAESGIRRTLPVFLPDGEHFLYVVNSSDEGRRGLYVASLSDPIGQRLLADQSSGVFVPNGPGLDQGHLLFVRQQTLMAVAFDAETRQLSGEPVVVATSVSFTNHAPQIAAFADSNGTLMYLANSRPDLQLAWYDRSGKEHGPRCGGGSGQRCFARSGWQACGVQAYRCAGSEFAVGARLGARPGDTRHDASADANHGSLVA